jgi:hypothetical protein
MVLDDVARVLCQTDQAYPPYLRAITLFGFQVAILSPIQPTRESKGRVLAGLKILEQLETETEVAATANLKRRLEIHNYSEILDLVMQEGGAKRLRFASTTKAFSKTLDRRRREARDVAQMVEFSHRFAEFRPPTSKAAQVAGSTMARAFVTQMGGPSDGTLKQRWRKYGDRAVLQYLMLVHHQKLKPEKLSARSFLEKLYEQAEDLETIHAFFVSYRNLRLVLKPRGYNFEEFTLDGFSKPTPEYALMKFSEKELRVIAEYCKNKP